jgi:hypothetical protein
MAQGRKHMGALVHETGQAILHLVEGPRGLPDARCRRRRLGDRG